MNPDDPVESALRAVFHPAVRDAAELDARWERIDAARGASTIPGRLSSVRQWWSVRPLSVVATLVVCVTSVLLAHITLQHSAAHRYTTRTGEVAHVQLADGSHVTLASGSAITVDPQFGTHHRQLSLVGEAYFDVTQASGLPFIVQTGRVQTKVLGTRFDIQHYPTDTTVRVAVMSGRVATTNARGTATLHASTVAQITDSAMTSTTNDAHVYADWTTGQLVFDDTPAAIMLATVARWYGYEFQLADSTIANRRIVAAFHISERKKTLAAIEYLLHVTMTFQGSTVIIQPNAGSTTPTPRRDVRPSMSTLSEVGK